MKPYVSASIATEWSYCLKTPDIEKNKIDAVGGGATGIGIDNNSSGNIFIVDNYVAVAATATPIESAGIGVLDNKVTVNGTPDSSFNDGE